MRRFLAFGLAWLAAAVVAVAVAWQGVGVIGSQVTDDRAAPLSEAAVRAAIEGSSDQAGGNTTTSGPAGTGARSTVPSPAGGDAAPSTSSPAPSGGADTVAATTRQYTLVGGSVALRFSPAGVTVLWATPNAGFEAQPIEPEHGNGVKVEFRSETHRSRVDGWWDGGPQDEVREEPH